MQTTGVATRWPRQLSRARATAPYAAAAGASTRAAMPASRHQNAGSRIMLAAFETDLHEIGFERSKSAIERAAQDRHGGTPGVHNGRALVRILEPGAQAHRELAHVGHLLGAMRFVERSVYFSKVPDMRAVQDGGTELDRLDRILSAMTRKRTA